MDPEADLIWYKRLSNNDTPSSGSNQAGFVVPKPLWHLFPPIAYPTVANTTPRVALVATLVNDTGAVAVVSTEYQLHNWNLTRTEFRVVGSLKHLLQNASGGDLVLIEQLEPHQHYKLSLARRGTPIFKEASRLRIKVSRNRLHDWGYLRSGGVADDYDGVTADKYLDDLANQTFRGTEANPTYSMSKRLARSRAFRRKVLGIYGTTCAICGSGLHGPPGCNEFEAAHIIPKKHVGTDDPRNGLSLCRAHHWAFDRGLVGVGHQREIMLHETVQQFVGYAPLKLLNGRTLLDPTDAGLRAHADALDHHRKHVFGSDPLSSV